jgi:hypothetical protein
MSMQLDRHRIAIRERNYLDVLDLALQVIRAYPVALFFALAAGIVPVAALNAWLLHGMVDLTVEPVPYSEAGTVIQCLGRNFPYFFCMLLLVVWEIPLATAPATLYLGQALFSDQPQPRRIAASFWKSLPQLLLYQVLVRGVLVPWVLTWFLPFSIWPYLNEVVLLERNPLRADRPGQMSTGRRRQALHAGSAGDLFLRWVAGVAIGLMLFLTILFSLWVLGMVLLKEEPEPGWEFYLVYYPVALWAVMGFFTVVRFLGYLDLRIRREGWEVELLMRAEGAPLMRQTT